MATLAASSCWAAAVESETAALSLCLGMLSFSTNVCLCTFLPELEGEWLSIGQLVDGLRGDPVQMGPALFASTVALDLPLPFPV